MKIKDKAYIAGIIDGEGGFCINKFKTGYRPYVSIANTDYRVIKYLQSHINGCVMKNKPRKFNHKPVYRLFLNSTAVRQMMDKVLPYLIVKKEQAILVKKALKISAQVKHRKGFTGSSNILQRPKLEILYQAVKKLNKRGTI